MIEEVKEEHNVTWTCIFFEEKGDIAEKHLIQLVVGSKHKNRIPILFKKFSMHFVLSENNTCQVPGEKTTSPAGPLKITPTSPTSPATTQTTNPIKVTNLSPTSPETTTNEYEYGTTGSSASPGFIFEQNALKQLAYFGNPC